MNVSERDTVESNASKVNKGLLLPVMEDFYTIQGEGFYTGQAAYFIRLGGCDVGCTWCDVKESWEASDHPLVTIEDIVQKAATQPARLVVITGGEPLMYDLGPLTRLLKAEGFTINLETSGAHPMSGDFDWVCLSPKKFKDAREEVFKKASELKVIVCNKHDLEWAQEHSKKVEKKCLLYLQPEWGKASKMIPLITDFVRKNPEWRISLQAHKYMNIP